MDESRKRNRSSDTCTAPGSSKDAPEDAAFADSPMRDPSTLLTTMHPETDSDLRCIKHQRLESTTASYDEHQVNKVSPYDAKSTLMHKESSVSSSNSGSGTDDLCGGATSSGNPGVVTASTAPNHNTSSLSDDDRSSSESAQGSANTGQSRAGRGEAYTAEHYYTGYGHGPSNMDNTSSFHRPAQYCDVEASHGSISAGANHFSVTSLAVADDAQQQLHRYPQQQHGTAERFDSSTAIIDVTNTTKKTARHVVVATDKGCIQPSPLNYASHMRHHARHYYTNRNSRGRGEDYVQRQGQLRTSASPLTNAASATLHGIPFAIGGPADRHHRYRNMNLNSDQHVSIMPNHYELRLPQSDELAVLQRVPRTHATVVAYDLPPPPTSSDARSTSVSSGSSSRSRKRTSAVASAGHSQRGTVESISYHNYSQPTFDSPQALLVYQQNSTGQSSTSDDSSEGAKSETDTVGSGSDEGYAASSEHQSGPGSGSDSTSSDFSKKGRGPARCAGGVSLLKVSVTMASQSDSKRTETSSMSSSVLADFSSGMNNEFSRTDSPRSSNKSSVSDKAPKKWKNEPNAKSSATEGFGPSANAMKSGLSIMEKVLHQKARSANHHHYHSRSTGRKMLEKSFLSAKRDLSTADAASAALVSSKQCAEIREEQSIESPDFQMGGFSPYDEASIYSLGQDVMAQVVAFLEPPEIQSFLTTPLSKTWLVAYTEPQGLWKIMCTSKPFYAKLDECDDSEVSDFSFPMCNDIEMRHLFGRYRLLYTSFVRCMKYLNRLQDDALNGRAPTLDVNSNQNDIYPFNRNASLKAYFAKARRLMRSSSRNSGSRSSSDAALSITSESGSLGSDEKVVTVEPMSRATESGKIASTNGASKQSHPTRQLGRSMLTDRLLRPARGGSVDIINLPWSCAIYSVVNWMVAFADVEGIQIMCLKCLPYLLEDESQRTTAQRAGLTDSVLRAMVMFPDSIGLHTVAFHTLVLLARPLGGNEGMLFHTAMVNTRGIFNSGSSNSKNGIVIMLDSMKRFSQDEILQAMSCWSLVNVALTPLQKSILVKLGGLTVTSNAMLQHPYNVEVQFRALFALINLVIPTESRPEESEEMREFEREILQQLGEVGETSEKEMLDASVSQISNLVVVAMKNFCSSEAILNRACLVLHNLSLNEEYHSILLWTPNCYQMLEWCLGNYPQDHVLQQSAGGTIQRLNATLSADDHLRARFTQSIRAQQQHSLDLARQEAVLLQEQQRQQENR